LERKGRRVRDNARQGGHEDGWKGEIVWDIRSKSVEKHIKGTVRKRSSLRERGQETPEHEPLSEHKDGNIPSSRARHVEPGTIRQTKYLLFLTGNFTSKKMKTSRKKMIRGKKEKGTM